MGKPDRFFVGAAIGAGALAQAAEKGGADFVLALTAGVLRMRGAPSIACMLPLLDANEQTLDLIETEIFPMCSVPIFAGLSAFDGAAATNEALDRAIELGVSGVINFPTVAHYSAEIRASLAHIGAGLGQEIAMMCAAQERGLQTIAHVTTADQAVLMARSGVDAVCFNYGWNAGGATGAAARVNLAEASVLAAEIRRKIRLETRSCQFMLEGGPIETADDLTTVLEASRADGYIGGSTIDRIPIESSVVDQTMTFKNALRALERRRAGRSKIFDMLRKVGLAGSSQRMFELGARLTDLAQSTGPALCIGEVGSGRRLALEAFGALRGIKADQIVDVSTVELTHAQILNRLFGTHGTSAARGFLSTHVGAVIVHDLDDLSRRLQRRLALYLDRSVFTPVNGRKPQTGVAAVYIASRTPLDRLVAAGHVDPLLSQVLAGRSINVPALRERAEDVDEVIEAMMRASTTRGHLPYVSPMAARILRSHQWPGNLTEARGVAETLLASLPDDSRITDRDVAQALSTRAASHTQSFANERDVILDALWRHGFNRTRTAEFLNISRKTLYNKIKRYGLTRVGER